MKKYISVFRIRFINSLQYRAAAFGEILKSFAWAFMEILAYTALYRTAGNAFPMEFSQTVSYVWMQQILFLMYSVVFGDEEIYMAIGSGSIAYELVRPTDLYAVRPLVFPVRGEPGGVYVCEQPAGIVYCGASSEAIQDGFAAESDAAPTFPHIRGSCPGCCGSLCHADVCFAFLHSIAERDKNHSDGDYHIFVWRRDTAPIFSGSGTDCGEGTSLCGDAEYAAADILRKADRYGCHAGCLFPAILAGGPGFNRTAFYEGVS